VWDEDRNYVAANDAACALVGKTHAELPYMMSVCWRKAPA
jgi:PAS domain-containing protein